MSSISFVIPVLNEIENIDHIANQLLSIVDFKIKEIIFVDDGSTDNTWNKIHELNFNNKLICGIKLSRNFGHQIAISAGLTHSQGEYVCVMDGDNQDSPESVKLLYNKIIEGFDVVYSIRIKRKENFIKRFFYKIYYLILKFLSNINIPLDSGDFCIMNKRVVDIINNMPEKHRFIRGLRAWEGFKQTGIIIERNERLNGTAKYTFTKLFKLAFDGIFSFSTIPLRMATYFGFIWLVISTLFLSYWVYIKLFYNELPTGFLATMCAITSTGGIQFIMLGMMGEYIGRIYEEVKGRPLYLIDTKVGLE